MVDEKVAETDPRNYYHKYHVVELNFQREYDDEDEEDI